MPFSADKARTDHFLAGFIYDKLRFKRGPLFLSWIKAPLFFGRRWIGVSLASTHTTSSFISDLSRALRPDKLKTLDWIKVASIHRRVLYTVLSLRSSCFPRWKYVRYSRRDAKLISNLSSTESLEGRPPSVRFFVAVLLSEQRSSFQRSLSGHLSVFCMLP